MAVTLQQIAEAAGVSRGTVDRAMNNRGRINPEVAERVLRLAEEMGYQPNRAGRALAMSKKSITIGVIVQAAGTPFMKKVLEGVQEAKEEVERLGAEVIVKEIENVDAARAAAAIQELKEAGCDGIALTPAEDEKLKEAVRALAEENIPVITFNSDAEESKRLCFVGQNAKKSGQAAAGLMAEIVPGQSQVLVISGYPANSSHKLRACGFCEEIRKNRDDVEILGIQYAFDDNQIAKMIAKGMLSEYKGLAGIYLAASGVQGVCAALDELGLSGKVKVISNDLTEENIRCLSEGKIHFLLGQNSYRQGYEPVMLLFDKLFDGKEPEEEYIYTEIVIKTKYNL